MIGDVHHYANGTSYIETEVGPMVQVTCDDCGAPAAAALEYTGVVRCSKCWPIFHGLVKVNAGATA